MYLGLSSPVAIEVCNDLCSGYSILFNAHHQAREFPFSEARVFERGKDEQVHARRLPPLAPAGMDGAASFLPGPRPPGAALAHLIRRSIWNR